MRVNRTFSLDVRTVELLKEEKNNGRNISRILEEAYLEKRGVKFEGGTVEATVEKESDRVLRVSEPVVGELERESAEA